MRQFWAHFHVWNHRRTAPGYESVYVPCVAENETVAAYLMGQLCPPAHPVTNPQGVVATVVLAAIVDAAPETER